MELKGKMGELAVLTMSEPMYEEMRPLDEGRCLDETDNSEMASHGKNSVTRYHLVIALIVGILLMLYLN